MEAAKLLVSLGADVNAVSTDGWRAVHGAAYIGANDILQFLVDQGAKLDVKNEARVHLWYEEKFGYPIPPYQSTAAAIATFPTTATAIGVRRYGAQFECCAPFGLDDLFDLIVRPNKVQITPAIYDAKVARWRAEWPQLTFLTWNECSS